MLLLLLAAARPASATFHEIKVVQVLGGSGAAPDAQYVELQAWAATQNFVGGHTLHFFDAAGTELTTENVTFPSSVANGADQMTLLIATSTAEELYGVTADLRMRPSLRVAGGKVCWDANWDCFAWGTYAGSSTGVGTPFQSVSGLLADQIAVRRIDICQTVGCSDTTLDAGDDTDNCVNDFASGTPAPKNNAGQFGAPNALAVFLDGFEDGGFTGWSAVEPPVV